MSEADISAALGGLMLSAVRTDSPMLVVRAARWWRNLRQLGIFAPFFVVHDLGLLFAVPPEQWVMQPWPGADAAIGSLPGLTPLVASYRGLVLEVASCDTVRSAHAAKLADALVVVVLARILGPVPGNVEALPTYPELPLNPALYRDLAARLPVLFRGAPQTAHIRYLGELERSAPKVCTRVDALDVDTLRLLGMFEDDGIGSAALAHVDLLAALASPMARDVVQFSLELLPAILETQRARAAGTKAEHGISGVGRRGTLDSLVLTEFAWDDAELDRRMSDGEVLYFNREQAPEEPARLHIILIDASASMRGDREVFARGLALALSKRLQRGGEDVWLRFFDSRLSDIKRVTGRSQVPAAWLLGFKGERGRNPSRVFAQLATELALLRLRDPREPIVHVITHAALHVPRAIMTDVRRQAHLFGVFVCRSGGALDLEWLDLISGRIVVDHGTLQQREARAQTASKIVLDLSRRA